MSDEASPVFEKLSLSLTPLERRELLDKITGKIDIDPTPLKNPEVDEEEGLDRQELYHQMGLWEKILLFFKTLFVGREREEVLEEVLLKRKTRYLEKRYSNLVSFKEGRFLAGMRDELQGLQEAASFWHAPYFNALGNRPRDFFVFLGSMEMPEIHEQLLRNTDPEKISRESGEYKDHEVKREIEFRIEDILGSIDERQRGAMYGHARFLAHMESLVRYPLQEALSLFKNSGEEAGTAPLGDLKKRLIDLADIMGSFSRPPDKILVEALFLYNNPDTEGSDQEELSKELKKFITAAGRSLERIRGFAARVPLVMILKSLTANLDFSVREMSGGEDWAAHYRSYWEKLGESQYQKYMLDRRTDLIHDEACEYLKINELPLLENYTPERWEEGIGLVYQQSAAFIKGFISLVMVGRMNISLKTLLLDGKFYKEANRNEYTEAYNRLLRGYERLQKINDDLGSEGQTGRALDDIKREKTTYHSRIAKMRNIAQKINREIKTEIKECIESIHKVIQVLYGVLYGKPGENYDGISNISDLSKNSSLGFLGVLSETHRDLDQGYQILTDLFDLEQQKHVKEEG